jgi:hypothetical protein
MKSLYQKLMRKTQLFIIFILTNLINNSNSFVHLSPIKYKLINQNQNLYLIYNRKISNIKENNHYHIHIHYHSSNNTLNDKININTYLLLFIFMYRKDINFIIFNIFFCIIQYSFFIFLRKFKKNNDNILL